MTITLKDIFNLFGSVIYNPDSFKTVYKVSIDSRTITKGALYVAIKGEKFDGHDFVRAALANGASSVVINQNRLNDFKDLDSTVITVPDTTLAYGELAKVFRSKFNGKVISITGSNGKTTTKEMLATILSEKFKVHKTSANNNNHIGIPKTIFATKRNTEVLILEHGTNHFGEIKYTAEIAQPDYSLITNIGASHLKYLKNIDGVYEEKKSLYDITLEQNGTIFVNNDDPILRSKTKNVANKISFGFRGKPNVKGKILSVNQYGQTEISVQYNGKVIEFQLPLYGETNAKNILAAITVALELGVSVSKIKSGIKKIEQVRGRLFVEKYSNMIVIDDTYNANPESLKGALELMRKIKIFKTKTVILGDMFELGKDSEKFHKDIISVIEKNKISKVYLLGKEIKKIASMLNENIEVKHFSRRVQLKKYIAGKEFNNQVVLVKGSRGMKMEEFLDEIRSKAV